MFKGILSLVRRFFAFVRSLFVSPVQDLPPIHKYYRVGYSRYKPDRYVRLYYRNRRFGLPDAKSRNSYPAKYRKFETV